MQKTIIFVCAALAIRAPGAWAQAGSAQDGLVNKIVDDTVQAITMKTMAAASGGTFVFVGGQLFNGKPVKGQPYSAEAVTETTQTLADGNRIVNRSSSNIYRDSEGRERREESIGKLGAWNAQGEPAKAVFISDPVGGVSYTLHPAERTAEKMAAPAATAAARGGMTTTIRAFAVHADNGSELPTPVTIERRGIAENASSTKTDDLGQQTIEGVVAQGTRTTRTIPAGQIGNERDINIVSERWFSNELGVVVMTKQSDPRMGETVYKLTNVNRNEPLHSMFEVPADYTVNDSAALDKVRQEKLQIRKDEQ
jgi:hypothetical protein